MPNLALDLYVGVVLTPQSLQQVQVALHEEDDCLEDLVSSEELHIGRCKEVPEGRSEELYF
jgi:hypothetical protein